MFVKWECGCIGLRVIVRNNSDEVRDIVIYSCDPYWDDDGLGFYERDMADKPIQLLNSDEVNKIIKTVDALMADGKRFRTIKALLK